MDLFHPGPLAFLRGERLPWVGRVAAVGREISRRCSVSNEGIDASLGLAFSLELFKRYRRSGILRAELPRAPGVHGRCTAFLHLIDGEVSSAYLEDTQGRRYSSDVAGLRRLDSEKGPFEWILIPQAPQATNPSQAPDQPARSDLEQSDQLPSSVPPSFVPRIIAGLTQERLVGWTPQQRGALYAVLTMINGERTVEAIKNAVPLPPNLVDELLRILLEADVISLSA